MLLGLETFSYHLAFAYKKMDVFAFIKRTAEFGLDGVEILIEGEDLSHLGSDDPGYLREIRAAIEERGLYVEIDTCNTNPKSLTRALKIGQALGAENMRVYSSVGGKLEDELKQAVLDFKAVLPVCADCGVRIAYENHEYESSHDVLSVVRQVNSPNVGTHIDSGNSMMVWEDPIEAIRNMAPYGVSTHFKDHLVIVDKDQPFVVGVPLGTGSIDLREAFRILAKESPLKRVNIEVCYGYIAPFRVPQEKGFGGKLGEGAFRVQPPPYDPKVVAPFLLRAAEVNGLNSFAWQTLSSVPKTEAERQELLDQQDRAVVQSVEYVKKLNASL